MQRGWNIVLIHPRLEIRCSHFALVVPVAALSPPVEIRTPPKRRPRRRRPAAPPPTLAVLVFPCLVAGEAALGPAEPALAQQLPHDVLVRIFAHSARAQREQEWGGLLEGCQWTSNESVAPLSSVCRNWLLPSQHVLFRSCSLLSAPAASAFLAVSLTRPDLIDKVRYLVIGLSEDETWPPTEEDDGSEELMTGRTQAATSCTSSRPLYSRAD